MIALFVQTLLLTGAAYFVGAAVACLVRRSFHTTARPRPVAAHPVEPLPEVMQRAAGPVRFGRDAESARSAPLPSASTAAQPAEPPPAQDLKLIRLIDADIETRLNKLGVRRYEEIAAWMQPEVIGIGQALGLGDRISRENWIEQAQVLAKGGVTNYAKRVARGEVARAMPTPDEGEPRAGASAAAVAPLALAPRASTDGAGAVAAVAATTVPAPAMAPTVPRVSELSPDVSGRAAFATVRHRGETAPAALAAGAPLPEPAVPVRPAAPAARDNLQRIGGIDGEVEKLLTAQGVGRYSQIAHWTPAEVARLDAQLGATGRIGRENWIEQAQILSRGGDTAFSRDYDRRARGEADAASPRPTKLADAIRENSGNAGRETPRQARTDLGSLRSVRSAAYQSTEPGADAAHRAANRALRSTPNDLKRIRGIGVLIERKLNQMGVVAYEQIANWTAEDIGRVSQSLDFKGRIERENWVEQARILASGGDTEFSRRVDRGEVETSRYRP